MFFVLGIDAAAARAPSPPPPPPARAPSHPEPWAARSRSPRRTRRSRNTSGRATRSAGTATWTRSSTTSSAPRPWARRSSPSTTTCRAAASSTARVPPRRALRPPRARATAAPAGRDGQALRGPEGPRRPQEVARLQAPRQGTQGGHEVLADGGGDRRGHVRRGPPEDARRPRGGRRGGAAGATNAHGGVGFRTYRPAAGRGDSVSSRGLLVQERVHGREELVGLVVLRLGLLRRGRGFGGLLGRQRRPVRGLGARHERVLVLEVLEPARDTSKRGAPSDAARRASAASSRWPPRGPSASRAGPRRALELLRRRGTRGRRSPPCPGSRATRPTPRRRRSPRARSRRPGRPAARRRAPRRRRHRCPPAIEATAPATAAFAVPATSAVSARALRSARRPGWLR